MANVVELADAGSSNLVQGGGTNSATFTMPKTGPLVVESVVATVDNTAGADTTATLLIRDQSGEVIATKRQDDVIPAADTGTATFALRVNDEQRRRHFGGGGLGSYFAIGEAIPAASQGDFPWTFSSGDALLDVSAGHERLPVVLYAGVYIVVAAVRCDAPNAGKQAFATLDLNSAGIPSGFASTFFPLDGVPLPADLPFATVTVGKYCNPGDSFDVIVGHNVGAGQTFSMFVTVQRMELR